MNGAKHFGVIRRIRLSTRAPNETAWSLCRTASPRSCLSTAASSFSSKKPSEKGGRGFLQKSAAMSVALKHLMERAVPIPNRFWHHIQYRQSTISPLPSAGQLPAPFFAPQRPDGRTSPKRRFRRRRRRSATRSPRGPGWPRSRRTAPRAPRGCRSPRCRSPPPNAPAKAARPAGCRAEFGGIYQSPSLRRESTAVLSEGTISAAARNTRPSRNGSPWGCTDRDSPQTG